MCQAYEAEARLIGALERAAENVKIICLEKNL